jgi:hypothetical protein
LIVSFYYLSSKWTHTFVFYAFGDPRSYKTRMPTNRCNQLWHNRNWNRETTTENKIRGWLFQAFKFFFFAYIRFIHVFLCALALSLCLSISLSHLFTLRSPWSESMFVYADLDKKAFLTIHEFCFFLFYFTFYFIIYDNSRDGQNALWENYRKERANEWVSEWASTIVYGHSRVREMWLALALFLSRFTCLFFLTNDVWFWFIDIVVSSWTVIVSKMLLIWEKSFLHSKKKILNLFANTIELSK